MDLTMIPDFVFGQPDVVISATGYNILTITDGMKPPLQSWTWTPPPIGKTLCSCQPEPDEPDPSKITCDDTDMVAILSTISKYPDGSYRVEPPDDILDNPLIVRCVEFLKLGVQATKMSLEGFIRNELELGPDPCIFLLQYLDWLDLIEHGSGIRCAWLRN